LDSPCILSACRLPGENKEVLRARRSENANQLMYINADLDFVNALGIDLLDFAESFK